MTESKVASIRMPLVLLQKIKEVTDQGQLTRHPSLPTTLTEFMIRAAWSYLGALQRPPAGVSNLTEAELRRLTEGNWSGVVETLPEGQMHLIVPRVVRGE